MKIDGVSVRPGMILEHQNKLWAVTKIQHTQPGKGGAYMQVEMKDIKVGTKTNVRFRSAETVERVRLDEREYQFLYAEGDMLTFMNNETYEQETLHKDLVGDQIAYLQDSMVVTLSLYEGNPIIVTLPDTVILEVVEADPVVKGQTATASYKPAMLENGVRTSVPPFVEAGVKIVVNTSDGSYVERAKE